MRRCSIWALAGFAGAAAASAVIGGLTQKSSRGWYRTLRKPAFNPPDWIFGPVWTGLYALMAVSAYRVWRRPASRERTRALRWWGAQLAANAAWTPLFFGAKRPMWALADLALLLVGLGAYLNEARKVDRAAAWMMVPYAAWSSFASVLNEEIVRLN